MLSLDRTISSSRFEQWNNETASPSVEPPVDMNSIESMIEEVRRNPSLDGFILPRRPGARCNGGEIARPAEPNDLANTRPAKDCRQRGLDSAIVQHYLGQIVELLKKLLEAQKASAQQPAQPFEPSTNSSEQMLTLIAAMAISLMQQQGTQLSAQFEQTLKGQIIFG